jgi:probable phosphoglycerate mutase
MSDRLKVVVEADGGARGNPGPAGYGAVVREAATGEVLLERAEALGVATNNVAEYQGLIAGLRAAAELGAVEVAVRMDSKLVVEQMAGRWQIKHPGLRPLAAQAAELVGRFDKVRFEWIPREQNRAADALANAAMDAAAGKPPKRELIEATPPPDAARDAAGDGGRDAARDGGRDARGDRGRDAAAKPREGAWAPPTATPTRLVLVRHGETELTAQRRYSGRGDVPLSGAGRVQAQAIAGRVAELLPSITAVVSSPLSRCVDTAKLIAGGAPVVIEPDLIECDFGDWEGLTFAEVSERWPAELDDWLASTAVAPPGGESFQAVAKRVRGAVARIRSDYPAGNVVLVSHVSPLKLMLRDALAAGDAFLHRLYLDTGGISLVDSWPDGNVAVRTVNETAHLAAR